MPGTPEDFEDQVREVLLLEDALNEEEIMGQICSVRHGVWQPMA